jgi:hypothetical protein
MRRSALPQVNGVAIIRGHYSCRADAARLLFSGELDYRALSPRAGAGGIVALSGYCVSRVLRVKCLASLMCRCRLMMGARFGQIISPADPIVSRANYRFHYEPPGRRSSDELSRVGSDERRVTIIGLDGSGRDLVWKHERAQDRMQRGSDTTLRWGLSCDQHRGSGSCPCPASRAVRSAPTSGRLSCASASSRVKRYSFGWQGTGTFSRRRRPCCRRAPDPARRCSRARRGCRWPRG